MAGGFEANAEENIILFRQMDGKRSFAKYDVGEIRAFRAPDPALQAGDVLVAPTSDTKEALSYILKIAPLATLVPYL